MTVYKLVKECQKRPTAGGEHVSLRCFAPSLALINSFKCRLETLARCACGRDLEIKLFEKKLEGGGWKEIPLKRLERLKAGK